MSHKDLVALYGRLGLIVAAFALVVGIIAGPLLQKVWSPSMTVTEKSEKPDLRHPIVPVSLQTKDRI